MIKYSIYTENKNIGQIKDTICQYYKGFTIIKTIGYWQGIAEKSLKIEILSEDKERQNIKEIVRIIKSINNQEAVLLTVEDVTGVLL
jgi:hypothetical protein